MAAIGSEIERLIQLLAKLPGLGPRSARRAVAGPAEEARHFAGAPGRCLARRRRCHSHHAKCAAISIPNSPCAIAATPAAIRIPCAWWRMSPTFGLWNGRACPRSLHVLAGRCRRGRRHAGAVSMSRNCSNGSPRVKVGHGVDEVILAMNATVEGQTTAHYLMDILGDNESHPAWRTAYRWAANSTIWTRVPCLPPSRRAARSSRGAGMK